LACAAPVPAQDYPTRPIRFITAAAQGGTSDILARIFAVHLTESLKQPVVVDNRASASGVIAGELTANAPPDGYTLLLAYHEHIAYKGAGPALMDLIAGQYHFNFSGIQPAQVQVRAGKLRGLAVTAPKRLAALPDLPAVAEELPGFEFVGWYGVIGPAGLPAPIVARLHDEFVKVLSRPDVRERIVADG